MTRVFSIAEIAEQLDVSDDAARGLIKYLLAIGGAEERGIRRQERGRGVIVYSLSPDLASHYLDVRTYRKLQDWIS